MNVQDSAPYCTIRPFECQPNNIVGCGLWKLEDALAHFSLAFHQSPGVVHQVGLLLETTESLSSRVLSVEE